MDNKAGGLFCVFSNGPSILGISAPTVYTIHSAPSPRIFSNIIFYMILVNSAFAFYSKYPITLK